MPGTKAKDRPGASYLTPWFIHRALVNAADNPAAPEAVAATLDLRRNEDGLTNQIWIGVEQLSGSNTVDVSLYRKEVGSWAEVVPWQNQGTEAGMEDGDVKIYTNLWAGEYKVVCTNLTATETFAIHVAHTE